MEITQEDRDRAMRILNFAFRNTDVEISGECFDDMASEIAAHRETTAIASEQAVLAKLRDLPVEVLQKAGAAFYDTPPMQGRCITDCIQTAIGKVADALESKQP